jgi:hypothetical protein
MAIISFNEQLRRLAAAAPERPAITCAGRTVSRAELVDLIDDLSADLAARGVASTRIATEGRGSREPIADNSIAAGRAKNRRVEIFVAEPAQSASR